MLTRTDVLHRLIPCAVAQNIQTMLIVRFIDGFAGSAFLSVAGGTVSRRHLRLSERELTLEGR